MLNQTGNVTWKKKAKLLAQIYFIWNLLQKAGVTYEKYATWFLDVMMYGFYECCSSQENTPLSI